MLKLLGVELDLVVEESFENSLGEIPTGDTGESSMGNVGGEVSLHFDSNYEILWRIINEYTSLVKLAIEGKPVGPGDKTLVGNLYIDHIKATTPSTAVKTIIIVALLNLCSERKIEPNGSFECKDYYVHKKLNILFLS
jgi:hypothetical protein